jgi:hypothetical protein
MTLETIATAMTTHRTAGRSRKPRRPRKAVWTDATL